MKGTSWRQPEYHWLFLLSVQIIFSVVLTSQETITSPADRCQETVRIRLEKALQIFAHERQRIFYSYFVSMQIMLYAHAQFDPKLAANCRQLSHKIMH